MTNYAALLRGINVGGRIIKKDELAAVFENLGLSDIRTVLQSGNVLFSSPETDTKKLEKIIEEALGKAFAYDAKVFVLSIEKLEILIGATPFKHDSPELHSYVIFMDGGLERDFINDATELEDEKVKTGDGVVYWQVVKGNTLKSKVGKLTGKSKYRTSLTNRNLNTLKKMTSR